MQAAVGLQKSWDGSQIRVNDLVGMAVNAGCPQNGVMQRWIDETCQVVANSAAASHQALTKGLQ